MKIHAIQLKHCLNFSNLHVQLKPNEHPVSIFLGDQSSGKTAILKNMFQALTWFSARLKDLRSAGVVILDSDIKHHQSMAKIDLSVEFPSDIGSMIESSDVHYSENTNCKWSLTKTIQSNGLGFSRVETEQLEHLVALYSQATQLDELQGLPMIAYYPSDRFINEVNLLSKNNPSVFQTHAAYEFAPLPYTTFARFFEWFREISDIENALTAQTIQKIIDQHRSSSLANSTTEDEDSNSFSYQLLQAQSTIQFPALQTLKQSLSLIFPEITEFYIEYTPKVQIMVNFEDQLVPFNSLSNSRRNWIALVGDIVRRLCILNPKSLSPRLDGEGILIIDSIEAQTDEYFQQTILDRLHQAFPNIQIIVSSCSTEILENAVNYQHFKIEHGQVREVNHQLKQILFDDLYERLMVDEPSNLTLSAESIGADTAAEKLYEQFLQMTLEQQAQFFELIQANPSTSFIKI